MEKAAAATREESVPKLRQLIEGIPTATLTTIDRDGALRSRPMATLPTVEGDDTDLWFFSEDHTAKVEEVMANPQVCVTYAQPAMNRFVSVSGKAELVRDRARMRTLWQPALKTWFPRGLDDPELALLHVDVISAQYWDAPSSRLVQLARRVKALATGGKAPATGESEKLTLKTRIAPDDAS